MEKILSIEETSISDARKIGIIDKCFWYKEYEGYKIITTLHEYFILISSFQECCESWGYFVSEDDVSDFIGKELDEIVLTNTELETKRLGDNPYVKALKDDGGWNYTKEASEIQFVDFKFSDGCVLQFAVYNAHNGYYGHPIYVVKDGKTIFEGEL
jgi:hypothetical protein